MSCALQFTVILWCYGTVHAGKMNFPYKLEILVAKTCMADCMVNLPPPSFPNNFTKNNRRDLKMSCIDASRYPLQSALKKKV